ncbi:hypothetical protein A0H76_1346 [Hepatospora eriocheir]|uniref:Uncharacterized protein n=1 Tax=Hepatospora eriocheir TaxID=1081669 RepID=A0A1X0Q5V9_9MICR|nr:hypothetical protein A0H76_1346 [Hepatospora eriocheir]
MLNTFIKIKIGFERMPFINYKFVLKIINEIENIFKDLVKRKKICTEKLVVKILNSSFKDSCVQKLCFTSDKRRFK